MILLGSTANVVFSRDGAGAGTGGGATAASALKNSGAVIPLAPVPSFTMSTNIGIAPFTVTFTDTSKQTPASWSWTFGDGSTSTLQNPSHTFTNIWRQTVTLTASNARGTNSTSQAVYQCFPCDALYDWNGGSQGQIANVTTLSNSLAPGSSQIGWFTTTNRDVPQNNLRGIIFTNLPGMTNGCPVVFSNGTICANFNCTNALAYCWTNEFEQYDLRFNPSMVITDLVLVFYDSMPHCHAVWDYCIDELCIATTKEGSVYSTSPDLGMYALNRNLGLSGGHLLPSGDAEENSHTSETCVPTTYGHTPFPSMKNRSFDGQNIYERHDKLYRILMEENTNGLCVLAVADPVTSQMIGFVTNWDFYDQGHLMDAYADGHLSHETFTNNGLGQSRWTNLTSILACHSVISINRPLSWYQVSNVVMFGP